MDLLVRVDQARGLDFASSSLFVEAATYLNASAELTEGGGVSASARATRCYSSPSWDETLRLPLASALQGHVKISLCSGFPMAEGERNQFAFAGKQQQQQQQQARPRSLGFVCLPIVDLPEFKRSRPFLLEGTAGNASITLGFAIVERDVKTSGTAGYVDAAAIPVSTFYSKSEFRFESKSRSESKSESVNKLQESGPATERRAEPREAAPEAGIIKIKSESEFKSDSEYGSGFESRDPSEGPAAPASEEHVKNDITPEELAAGEAGAGFCRELSVFVSSPESLVEDDRRMCGDRGGGERERGESGGDGIADSRKLWNRREREEWGKGENDGGGSVYRSGAEGLHRGVGQSSDAGEVAGGRESNSVWSSGSGRGLGCVATETVEAEGSSNRLTLSSGSTLAEERTPELCLRGSARRFGGGSKVSGRLEDKSSEGGCSGGNGSLMTSSDFGYASARPVTENDLSGGGSAVAPSTGGGDASGDGFRVGGLMGAMTTRTAKSVGETKALAGLEALRAKVAATVAEVAAETDSVQGGFRAASRSSSSISVVGETSVFASVLTAGASQFPVAGSRSSPPLPPTSRPALSRQEPDFPDDEAVEPSRSSFDTRECGGRKGARKERTTTSPADTSSEEGFTGSLPLVGSRSPSPSPTRSLPGHREVDSSGDDATGVTGTRHPHRGRHVHRPRGIGATKAAAAATDTSSEVEPPRSPLDAQERGGRKGVRNEKTTTSTEDTSSEEGFTGSLPLAGSRSPSPSPTRSLPGRREVDSSGDDATDVTGTRHPHRGRHVHQPREIGATKAAAATTDTSSEAEPPRSPLDTWERGGRREGRNERTTTSAEDTSSEERFTGSLPLAGSRSPSPSPTRSLPDRQRVDSSDDDATGVTGTKHPHRGRHVHRPREVGATKAAAAATDTNSEGLRGWLLPLAGSRSPGRRRSVTAAAAPGRRETDFDSDSDVGSPNVQSLPLPPSQSQPRLLPPGPGPELERKPSESPMKGRRTQRKRGELGRRGGRESISAEPIAPPREPSSYRSVPAAALNAFGGGGNDGGRVVQQHDGSCRGNDRPREWLPPRPTRSRPKDSLSRGGEKSSVGAEGEARTGRVHAGEATSTEEDKAANMNVREAVAVADGGAAATPWPPRKSAQPAVRVAIGRSPHRAESEKKKQVQHKQQKQQQQNTARPRRRHTTAKSLPKMDKTSKKTTAVVMPAPAQAVESGPGLRSTHFAPGYLGVAWPDPLGGETVGAVRDSSAARARARILTRLEEAASRKVAEVEERARRAQRERLEKLRRRNTLMQQRTRREIQEAMLEQVGRLQRQLEAARRRQAVAEAAAKNASKTAATVPAAYVPAPRQQSVEGASPSARSATVGVGLGAAEVTSGAGDRAEAVLRRRAMLEAEEARAKVRTFERRGEARTQALLLRSCVAGGAASAKANVVRVATDNLEARAFSGRFAGEVEGYGDGRGRGKSVLIGSGPPRLKQKSWSEQRRGKTEELRLQAAAEKAFRTLEGAAALRRQEVLGARRERAREINARVEEVHGRARKRTRVLAEAAASQLEARAREAEAVAAAEEAGRNRARRRSSAAVPLLPKPTAGGKSGRRLRRARGTTRNGEDDCKEKQRDLDGYEDEDKQRELKVDQTRMGAPLVRLTERDGFRPPRERARKVEKEERKIRRTSPPRRQEEDAAVRRRLERVAARLEDAEAGIEAKLDLLVVSGELRRSRSRGGGVGGEEKYGDARANTRSDMRGDTRRVTRDVTQRDTRHVPQRDTQGRARGSARAAPRFISRLSAPTVSSKNKAKVHSGDGGVGAEVGMVQRRRGYPGNPCIPSGGEERPSRVRRGPTARGRGLGSHIANEDRDVAAIAAQISTVAATNRRGKGAGSSSDVNAGAVVGMGVGAYLSGNDDAAERLPTPTEERSEVSPPREFGNMVGEREVKEEIDDEGKKEVHRRLRPTRADDQHLQQQQQQQQQQHWELRQERPQLLQQDGYSYRSPYRATGQRDFGDDGGDRQEDRGRWLEGRRVSVEAGVREAGGGGGEWSGGDCSRGRVSADERDRPSVSAYDLNAVSKADGVDREQGRRRQGRYSDEHREALATVSNEALRMRDIKEDMASVLQRLREGDILPSAVAATEDARRGSSEGVRGGVIIEGGDGGRVDRQAEEEKEEKEEFQVPPSSFAKPSPSLRATPFDETSALADLEFRIASLGGILDSYSSDRSSAPGTPSAAVAPATRALGLQPPWSSSSLLSPSPSDRVGARAGARQGGGSGGRGGESGERWRSGRSAKQGEGTEEEKEEACSSSSSPSLSPSISLSGASDLAREVDLLLSAGAGLAGGRGSSATGGDCGGAAALTSPHEASSFDWKTKSRRFEDPGWEGLTAGGGGTWDELEGMAERLEALAGSVGVGGSVLSLSPKE